MREVTLLELREAARSNRPLGPTADGAPQWEVDADVLRAAILSEYAADRQLWLRSVRVEGLLDLDYQQIAIRLRFDDCIFEAPLLLGSLKATEITLIDCTLQGRVLARQIEIAQNLFFTSSVFAAGLELSGARLGGLLLLRGARVESPNDLDALNLDEATIEGRVDLTELTALGRVTAYGCRVRGQISLRRATITAKAGSDEALVATNLDIGESALWEELRCSGEVNASGARFGAVLALSSAHFESRQVGGEGHAFFANNLTVAASIIAREMKVFGELRLNGANIGGQLLVDGSVLDGGDGGIALDADRISVGGSLAAADLRVDGEIRMLGADIGGQLALGGSVICAAAGGDALSLDGAKIGDGFFLEDSRITGEVRIPGLEVGGNLALTRSRLVAAPNSLWCIDGTAAEIAGGVQGRKLEARGAIGFADAVIGGQVALPDAVIELPERESESEAALSLERSAIRGGVFLGNARLFGELRLVGAEIGLQFSIDGARLERNPQSTHERSAFNGEGLELNGSLSCVQAFVLGEFRMVGAVINGQAAFQGTYFEARQDDELGALALDNLEVKADVFFQGVRVVGLFRSLHMKVGGQFQMFGAVLESQGEAALLADGIEVVRGMLAAGLRSHGQVRFYGAKMGAQLALNGAVLNAPRTEEEWGRCLVLNSAELDMLILTPEVAQGPIDLRHATVRSLWDASADGFVGQHPCSLLLNGFQYDLQEPLDTERRLKWAQGTGEEPYYPGVYRELAEAFRRVGRGDEARDVLIAGERRARHQLRRFSARGLWQDLLWATVGYGYRNWRAAVWLLVLIAAGSLAFKLGESSFSPKENVPPPDFNPVLYAVDATVPILDAGQQGGWIAEGAMAWIALILSVSGYALATAVIAAAAGLLNRDQPR